MEILCNANLSVGFEATTKVPGAKGYLDLNDAANKRTPFKSQFGSQTVAAIKSWYADEGFPHAMDGWQNFVLNIPNDDGFLSEADIQDVINARLNLKGPVEQPNPKFQTGDRLSTRYIYVEGVRVCQHMYEIEIFVGPGNYDPWFINIDVDGVTHTETAAITLGWETLFELP